MSRRRVHFSVPLHQIEYLDQQWETASRLARDGSSWLRMGIDRQRFRDRIERAAEVLDRILDFEFRQQIYKERFENLHNLTENHESGTKTNRAHPESQIEVKYTNRKSTKKKKNKNNRRKTHNRGKAKRR